MAKESIYTGLMSDMRDWLREVVGEADYPRTVDYLSAICMEAIEDAWRLGWKEAHETEHK